jgi:hypothetical protein
MTKLRVSITLAFVVAARSGSLHAQPVVKITPHGGSVSGTFAATVGICSPEARSIVYYKFTYAGSDVTDQFTGGSAAAPSWCRALSADPTYEEWSADLSAVSGLQVYEASVIDSDNFGGEDDTELDGGSHSSVQNQQATAMHCSAASISWRDSHYFCQVREAAHA